MTPPPAKPVPRFLAVLGVLLALVLAWRAYSPHWGARPTDTVFTARPVNVNAADKAELLQIPGVGPHMADAILAHRKLHGQFETLEELDRVPGIGAKTLEKLRPWLAIGPAPPRSFVSEPVEKLERKTTPKPAGGLVNVNTASIEELETLPGIGPKLAERIITERAKGPFKNVEDLRRVSGIGPKTIEKLRPLVSFEH